MEACHVFVLADTFFHTLWPWYKLIRMLPRIKSDRSKWFAVECIGELCQMGRGSRCALFTGLSPATDAYDKFAFEYLGKNTSRLMKLMTNVGGDIPAVIGEGLCDIEGVMLVKEPVKTSLSNFVSLPSRVDLIREIALAISERKQIFLTVSVHARLKKNCRRRFPYHLIFQGPLGCGKTKMVEHLATATGHKELTNFFRIAMNDQVDGKALLGSYSCQEVPGQFLWANGIVTSAVLKGDWLLIEDVDQAPPDVLSVLEPLIQRRELHILSRGVVLQAHPAFQLFITSRLPMHSVIKLKLTKLSNQLSVVHIPPWSEDEMLSLLTQLFPTLAQAVSKMIAYFFNLENEKKGHDVRQRPPTIRDLIKWCQRCSRDKAVDAEDFVLEGLDCFCSFQGKAGVQYATKLAHLFNVTSQRMFHLMEERSPTLTVTKDCIKIGRAQVPRMTVKKAQDGRPYFLTRPASRLLEFIAMCIRNNEPTLIVGETGVGKTSAIQHLAEATGHELVAVNLNQQTESCDLIGGIKPVSIDHYVTPVYNDFLSLFVSTFESKENAKFLAHLSNCRSKKRWRDLVGLMLHATKQAGTQMTQLDRWALLLRKMEQVDKAVQTDNRLYFAFIQGVLARAATQGQWILLDEINMAESDVLDCIAEILNPDIHEVCVQANNDQALSKHPNFRVFACMNPSTDVGKKELSGIIRTRFTEYFIEEPYNDQDLLLIVRDYLKPLDVDAALLNRIVRFYNNVKKLAKTTLMDGTGHQPTFSLRTLCRALNVAVSNPCQNSARSIVEAFVLCFLTELDRPSYNAVFSLIMKQLAKNNKKVMGQPLPCPLGGGHINIECFWVPCGSKQPSVMENYILTPTVRRNLKDIARVISLSNFAVLLQGETSVGKTSMITYLAEATGNTCVRVNNHEHTDVQEYLGSYMIDEDGVFRFHEGILPLAMRSGFWIILDELNLAPTDVLEALNRVLDDNRELFIPETQTVIKAHPNFRLFATQNPTGSYGGRKPLSRAFRNRFVELHFGELPHEELSEIIEKRGGIARSQSVKLVQVLRELQLMRRNSATFEGKYSFLTLRDLFRWSTRCSNFVQEQRFYDWEQHFADEGFLVLTSRTRGQDDNKNEEAIISQVLEKVFKRKVDAQAILDGALLKEEADIIANSPTLSDMVWTSTAKRLALLILHSFRFREPVLLVGETGCGKTRVCQTIASLLYRELISINCHLNTESSDFLGGLRPNRGSGDRPFEWVDGPLVKAMETGAILLVDEISLAEDGVLERLNSVLESTRSLYLMEQSSASDEVSGVRNILGHDHFQLVATMNPGGDFGKRELSPALRNRLVEIWCPSIASRKDLVAIMEAHIGKESSDLISEVVLTFIEWYDRQPVSRKMPFTTRDLVAWMTFIKDTVSKIGHWCAVVHGVCLVIVDGLATVLTGEALREFTLNAGTLMSEAIPQDHKGCDCFQWIVSKGSCQVVSTPSSFGIGPFLVDKRNSEAESSLFQFHTETVARNSLKIMRGLQVQKAFFYLGWGGGEVFV
jgi:midasin